MYAVTDDILVAGTGDTMRETIDNHDVKSRRLLKRCQERAIMLNEQKIVFNFK